jgi:regulatory protein YycI of two-component signal transduction system YycFG
MEKQMTDAREVVEEGKNKKVMYFIIGGVVGGTIAYFGARNSKYKDKLWIIIAAAFIVAGYLTMLYFKKKGSSDTGKVKPAEIKGDDTPPVVTKVEETEPSAPTSQQNKDAFDRMMIELRANNRDISFDDERKFRMAYASLSEKEKVAARDMIHGLIKVMNELVKKGEKDFMAYAKALGEFENAMVIKHGAPILHRVKDAFEGLDWNKSKK